MVEKLLTNWMSICLYTFVRVRDAEVDGAPLQGGAGLCKPRSPQPPCSMSSVTLSPLHPSLVWVVSHIPVPIPVTCPGGSNCLPLFRTR